MHHHGFRFQIVRPFAGAAVLGWLLACPLSAQQSTVAAPGARGAATVSTLVFTGVTVIDVEGGRRLPAQTVVVIGNRIRAVGPAGRVRVPPRARVVDARGQYVIPGLWDMHVHPWDYTSIAYPLLIANGVMGIRDPGSTVPLATLRQWREDILAGRRVGPPRQRLAGPSVGGCPNCPPGQHASSLYHHIVATSPEDGRFLVDSLAAAGADFIKSYDPPPPIYFAMAAEARRIGISFEGHGVPTQEALDSGQRAFDHRSGDSQCDPNRDSTATLETCRQLAAELRRHDAWLVPTLSSSRREAERHLVRIRYMPDSIWKAPRPRKLSMDSFFLPRLLGRAIPGFEHDTLPPPNTWSFAERANLPLLAGTDATFGGILFPDPIEIPGFSLHDALEAFVDGGMSPLGALRAATLAPAEYLHATDSLGSVARGKLADLVFLEGDPLADIRNTTKIVAVVANGRYFDRAALDHLLAEAERAKVTAPPIRRRPKTP